MMLIQVEGGANTGILNLPTNNIGKIYCYCYVICFLKQKTTRKLRLFLKQFIYNRFYKDPFLSNSPEEVNSSSY